MLLSDILYYAYSFTVGWLIDSSGSYDLTFYLAGAVISISGLVLLIAPCARKCRHLARKEYVDEEDPVDGGSALHERNSLNNLKCKNLSI